MPSPASSAEFLDLVRKSGVAEEKRLDPYLDKLRAADLLPGEPSKLAGILVRDGVITHFQAEQIMLGKWRRFTIGKYKVLERLGSGGMGSVYLCEHKLMRRRVAVKVLPTAKAADPSALERFYREARAVAALDHPNIVHAYDIDQDENLHFLVMEYVDGANLQEMVKRSGPLDPIRAAHYIAQAALGLHQAHVAGLVHRDIKPGNILVDRQGTVKILDMGLARFFNDEEDILTKKYDENVLGTADYLAPEQALDSHGVDHRADIYSLGATFYFILTGRSPFGEGTIAQKLIWHQTRQPKPIRSLRPEAPEELVAVIDKMMAKDPAQRHGTPLEVVEALAPWTQTPIPPPPEIEMPRLSLAATGVAPADASGATSAIPVPPSPTPRKNWQVPPSGALPTSKPPERTAQTSAPAPAAQTVSPPVRPSPPASRPRPTPNPPGHGPLSPAPAPAAPASEEDSIPWEKLAAETEDLAARGDTPSRSSRKKLSPSGTSFPSRSRVAAAWQQRRALWVVATVSVFVLVILFFLWLKFGGSTRNATDRTLHVGPESAYRSIGAALYQANAGDRILVARGRYTERIDLSEKNNLTIEFEAGVELRPAPGQGYREPLLKLYESRDIHIEGNLTLDGQDKLRNLVDISGNCPGVVLKGLHFQGYKETALWLTNCAGSREKPIQLDHLVTKPPDAQPPLPAMIFLIQPIKNMPSQIDHLRIQDCFFKGEYKSLPIRFEPNDLGTDVEFRGNEPAISR